MQIRPSKPSEPPRYRTLSKDVEFKQCAVPEKGKGLFAKTSMKKGDFVLGIGGILVVKEDIETYAKKNGSYGLQIDDQWFVSPGSREEVQQIGAINHSCEPNSGLKDALTFVTMRDVYAGEELTTDYAMTGTMISFSCSCGSSSCRGRVTPEDWKIKDLQAKYRGYFSEYRKRLIQRES
jgi:hypothetical protein